jgi:murein DD-endopeptidase MepM/ murein hydrolase activator NlpD
MAVEIGTAYLAVLPSARGFGKALDAEVGRETRDSGEKAGKSFGGGFVATARKAVGPLAAAFAGIKIGGVLTDAIGQASDLGEAGSKTAAIFGKDGAKALDEFAKGSAKRLGQTKLQILDAAGTFGTFGKAAGLGGQDLVKFSTGFSTLSTDMASFFNTSPEEAMQAIASGLRGEAEPLRKYGVLLDDASLRQEALAQGLIKTTKQALTPQQKVLAAQALIYKQTKTAQGDFARTSDGLANQQRILSAQWTEAKATLGTQLLPAVTGIVSVFNRNFTPAIDGAKAAAIGIRDTFNAAAASFERNRGPILGVASVIGTLLLPLFASLAVSATVSGVKQVAAWSLSSAGATKSAAVQVASHYKIAAGWVMSGAAAVRSGAQTVAIWAMLQADALRGTATIVAAKAREAVAWTASRAAMIAASVASKAVTAAQWLLNAALTANPIGIVVVAIAGLVAALVIAYKKSETFRKVVQTVWAAVKLAAKTTLDWLRAAIPAVIGWLAGAWAKTKAILVNPVIEAGRRISTGVAEIRGKFSAAATWVRSTFSDGWARLREILLAPVRYARDKIGDVLGQIRGKFSTAVSGIGSAWDRLKEVAKAPIRFVVDTVLDNALLGAFRRISDIIGYDRGKDLHVSLPRGFASGGYTGPGHRLKPAGVVHAGEVVFDQAAVAAAGGPYRLDAFRKSLKRGRAKLPPFAKGGIVWPTPGRQTGTYPGHTGVDINRGSGWEDHGDPIYAAAGGRITHAGFGRGYGNAVFQQANTGHLLIYGHASATHVRPGQVVKAGQLIANVGNTGNSSAPHLHFEVRPGATFAAAMNYLQGAAGPVGGGKAGGPVASLLGKLAGLKDKLAVNLDGLGSSTFAGMAGAVPKAAREALVDFLRDKVPGFAGGTHSAPRGLAWTGERGPELVNFRGGERVYTASESAALAGATGGTQVVIEGNVLNDDLIDQLVAALDRRDRRAALRANLARR